MNPASRSCRSPLNLPLILKTARVSLVIVSVASSLILFILGFMVATGSMYQLSKTEQLSGHRQDGTSVQINDYMRQIKSESIDVERNNITVVLQYLQFGYEAGSQANAPWMYTTTGAVFEESNSSSANLAHTHVSWNENGTGNGTCASGGSGKTSRGYVDPFHFYANISDKDFSRVKVELRNLSLSSFDHINTVDGRRRWDILGQAGDSRLYSGGTFSIYNGNQILLSTRNVRWHQNISYPSPVGEAPPDDLLVGAYFTAEIDVFQSHEEWVRELDPHSIGFVLGLVTAASYGPMDCFSLSSYWIALRGFPDLKEVNVATPFASDIYNDTARSGAKQGQYKGSLASHVAQAKTLGGATSTAATVAVSSSVGGAVGSMSVSVGSAASAISPPGQGIARMLSTASFFARIGEIHGFHSDAMSEFGESMRPFVAKFPFPGFKGDKSQGGSSGGKGDSEGGEDNADLEVSVSDAVFAGCALYTSLIVIVFLLLHAVAWLFYRKKTADEKIKPQAWLVYLSSIAMSYVFAAAVLNASQYLRSHVGRGGGRPGFYVIAILQLAFIGIGFTAFVLAVVFYALRKLWRQDMKWVPRIEIPDPSVRNSPIRGEYNASENDTFHTLFECYYSSLAGPRVWLVGLELCVVVVDSVCTAIIWNEVVVLGILIAVYASLFVLFFAFAPYVDKIEGRIVSVLGLIDLMVLVVEFMGALGSYETAEQMDYIAVILGFVSISLAVLCAIYCDLIPMSITVWGIIRRKLQRFHCLKFDGSGTSDEESEWSFLQGSWEKESESAGDGHTHSNSGEISAKGHVESQARASDRKEARVQRLSSAEGANPRHGPLTPLSQIWKRITGRGSTASEQRLPVVVRINQEYDRAQRESPEVDAERHHGRVLEELCQDLGDDEEPITWPRVGQVIYQVRGRSTST